jgi:hypothetical protein
MRVVILMLVRSALTEFEVDKPLEALEELRKACVAVSGSSK